MNTFGTYYRLTSFGESHGRGVGGLVVVDLNNVQADARTRDQIVLDVLEDGDVGLRGGTHGDDDRVAVLLRAPGQAGVVLGAGGQGQADGGGQGSGGEEAARDGVGHGSSFRGNRGQ